MRKRNKEETVMVEDCHEAIISKSDFNKVQRLIANRRPEIIHPKSVSVKNLLNGLLHCSSCNKLFTSYSAKSGKFHYYICQSKHKSGNSICDQKSLNIKKFDGFIISVIKDKILTPENITKLVKLVNKEFGILKKEFVSKLTYIKNSISDKKKRINKLFDALETTELDMNEIAPRIKQLSDEINSLESEQKGLETKLNEEEIPQYSEEEIKPYVEDLQNTLQLGSLMERKSFIRSFIEKIWIDFPTTTIEYSLPLNKVDNSNKEVLVFDRCG